MLALLEAVPVLVKVQAARQGPTTQVCIGEYRDREATFWWNF